MSIFDVFSLLGGLAMFLYGMRLMGDSLKENSSGTLKLAMEKVTNSAFKAFLLGMAVTALIQSSTATIVITAGLVGAGILTLHQSLGIIIGANVGTTVTGQIIRLLDVKASGSTQWLRFFQPSTLAPIALILGMVLIMTGRPKKNKSIGNIAIGFGILFSGLLNMTSAVNALSESGLIENLFAGLGSSPVLGYLTGAGVAFMLQSSSATIGILQAFSQTGLLTFKAIYAVIVGIYLGDCVTTAIVCSIGARPEAKRVGIVNILFNLSETVLVLLGVTVIHRLGVLDGLWNAPVTSGIIANTNTIFNLSCAILLLPMVRVYEKTSRLIVRDEAVRTSPYQEKMDALNPAFFNTPALALNACYDILLTMFNASRENIARALKLMESYSEADYEKVLAEEDDIDRMTDAVSRYSVQLLPHLQSDYHVSILNQYYKVTGEFEHIGDHAVNIADNAKNMNATNIVYSATALRELHVIEAALENILDDAGQSFKKRDGEAAERIEPLVEVIDELAERLKQNHFTRMINGECNLYADSAYTDLLEEIRRIAGGCSNVGVATMVRIHPELADQKHLYFDQMHRGGNTAFDRAFAKDRDKYFTMLDDVQPLPAETAPATI